MMLDTHTHTHTHTHAHHTLELWLYKPNYISDIGEEGATEDEMVGWHHRLNRHESEQTEGDSVGQGSLELCSPWDHGRVNTT